MIMGANILNREKSIIEFRTISINSKKVSLLLKQGEKEIIKHMEEERPHIYITRVEGMGLDLLYKYRLEGKGDFPDPYSHYQPEGVHGYSQVVDHGSYEWRDSCWQGLDLEDYIIYELHVGTFSPEGTFKGVEQRLDYLKDLGITAVEFMPLTQTPGRWNWGYDGCNLFSVNSNYGTPQDLKCLVDACHQRKMAVILDVVYNHLGPEGNYLPFFGPFFTDKHETPWGPAVNFDDDFCEITRSMVLDNVRYWLEIYHFDALRLDAVHTIKDGSEPHILQEIAQVTKETAFRLGRKLYTIAETDENNVKIINSPEKGGYGIDAQWMDDFHHVIHSVLTGEKEGYYQDYGRLEDLEKVFKNFLYTGEYSHFWQKKRGTDASANPGRQFVVCLQNHDQVGNRGRGERLSLLVDFPFLKAAAGLLFMTPYIPLLFMGEEYAEKKPFLFFTDYIDQKLKKAVSEGRKEEFKGFNWDVFPDPEDDASFFNSRLTPEAEWKEENKKILNFYKDLIALRKKHPALHFLDKDNTQVKVNGRVVEVSRRQKDKKIVGIFNLGDGEISLKSFSGKQILNSAWEKYGGSLQGSADFLGRGEMVLLEQHAE